MGRKLSDRRKYDTRSEHKTVYIYSEGTVTEPNYFDQIKQELRLPEVHIEAFGTGFNTMSLVEYALNEQKNRRTADDEYWVVFDKDDHTNFNKAIESAESKGLRVAYSNECFELWFILHFEYLQSALGRNKFEKKLTELLGTKYKKNMDVYSLLKEKEGDAIRNAKSLEQMHNSAGVSSQQERVPSTTVYELVEHLRELGKDIES